MTKHNQTIVLTIYFVLGIIAFYSSSVSLLSLLLFIITLFLIYKKIFSEKFGLFIYALFVLSTLLCIYRIKESDELSGYAPTLTTMQAQIISIPENNYNDQIRFYAKVRKITNNNSSIIINNSKTRITIKEGNKPLNKLDIGDRITITGQLYLPKQAQNPNQFDYAKFLKNKGVYTTFYSSDNNIIKINKPDSTYWKTLQFLNSTRTSIIYKHSKIIKSPNLELLGGIVFGDDAINPTQDLKDSFRHSGLLHILAASGMNVTLIFGIWYFIAQRIRLNYKISIGIGMLLIIVYTCMTGFGPSILRASIMLLFILFGKLIDKDANSVSLLFFVALILLIYNPALINDIGFQLSFIVTLGLLVTCPPILKKIPDKYAAISSACIVPIIAQIYVTPIQMYYFGTFSTYSILANITTIPFLTAISFIGFVGSIFSLAPLVGNFICLVCDYILNPFLTIIINISDIISKTKNSLLQTYQPSITQILLYFSIILSLTITLSVQKIKKESYIILGVLLILFCTTFIKLPTKNCEIIFFSVGNADSALIKSPENKYILIDTGKMPYNQAKSQAEQIIVKYLSARGIKKIDALILTHFDSDHAGGTLGLLNKIKVKKIYITHDSSPTKLSKKILYFLKNNNYQYKIPSENEVILEESNFKLTNISRQRGNIENENDNSLIELLECNGAKVLFMADGGFIEFNSLDNSKLKNIDVLKVGHHGGKSALNSKMLDTLSPKIAIISTGQNNYGHPTKYIIDLLEQHNAKILRTDYNNALKVTLGHKEQKYHSFSNKTGQFVAIEGNKNNKIIIALFNKISEAKNNIKVGKYVKAQN